MLDINLIHEQTDYVKKGLLKKMPAKDLDLDKILALDDERKELLQKVEALKAERNKSSKIKPTPEVIEQMKKVGEGIKELDDKLGKVEAELTNLLAHLPNLPDEDVPAGGKENNEVIRTWGKKPKFSFPAKDHIELVESLGLVDYQRGAKMGGSGFWVYKGDGALLEWALLNYFIEEHLKDGYELILPPHILNYECGYTAGQFPKFIDDVFQLKNDDDKMQFLLPTAETALINYHRDEILDEDDLPKKYFSYTPCYRKEAGSYRTEERGMIRGHQFNKVEMFQYTKPEDSSAALEELIEKAEKLVRGLGLHYRVSKLAAADCSASMAKTYDIEVWIPSMNQYKEVSSASNARDYQARRGNMKFIRRDPSTGSPRPAVRCSEEPSGSRRELLGLPFDALRSPQALEESSEPKVGSKAGQVNKKEYLHTLNASGLATSRLLPAIVEQFQQKDGSVEVPKLLRKWVGKKVLR